MVHIGIRYFHAFRVVFIFRGGGGCLSVKKTNISARNVMWAIKNTTYSARKLMWAIFNTQFSSKKLCECGGAWRYKV